MNDRTIDVVKCCKINPKNTFSVSAAENRPSRIFGLFSAAEILNVREKKNNKKIAFQLE